MSDPLEAAAEAFYAATPPEAKHMIVEFMRAAIGCPNCDGTNAEHVEVVFLGETIYADPDKCEWRCERAVQWATASIFDGKPGTNDCDPRYASHFDCGWQPKWDAIKGDET